MPSQPRERLFVATKTPLRQVVALCLEAWGVSSEDESDTDDSFCGWRVGSRRERPQAVIEASGATAQSCSLQ